MTAQFFDLCNEVADAIKEDVSGLIGKPEAGAMLRIGADGTPTEMIDEVAENAALRVLENDGRSMRFVSEELGEKILGRKNKANALSGDRALAHFPGILPWRRLVERAYATFSIHPYGSLILPY
jgi:hypothetical protein